MTNLDDFVEDSGVAIPEGPYETAAGFVVAGSAGCRCRFQGRGGPGGTLTVVEMDGRRIARLRVEPHR